MGNKGTYRKDYYEAHREQFIQNTKNYQSKMQAFTIRVKPSALASYKAAAAKLGMSLRAFILEAIDEKIGKIP